MINLYLRVFIVWCITYAWIYHMFGENRFKHSCLAAKEMLCCSETDFHEHVRFSTSHISAWAKLVHLAILWLTAIFHYLDAVAMATPSLSQPWVVVLFQASYANMLFSEVNKENKSTTCPSLCAACSNRTEGNLRWIHKIMQSTSDVTAI